MSDVGAELDAIGRRIERLTVEPGAIAMPVTRLFAPLLFRIGWRPRSRIDKVRLLFARMRGQTHERPETSGDDHRGERDTPGKPLPSAERLLEQAVKELDDNLRSVERATVVNQRALVAQAAWLRRLYEVLVHANRAILSGHERTSARIGRVVDDALLSPPLSLGKAIPADQAHTENVDSTNRRQTDGRDVDHEMDGNRPDSTRVLELQLDTIDHLLDAARDEHRLFARKRRLLEAARQLLLETSAALDLDHDGVHRRLQSVARQITRIDRMQALGLRGDVSLLHQARTALARGQREPLFAALLSLEQAALTRGDAEVAERTGDALGRLGDQAAPSVEAAQASVLRSAKQSFGADVVAQVEAGFSEARGGSNAASEKFGPNTGFDSWMFDLFRDHIAPGAERSSLAAALAVDGCFDLGGAMTPVRIQENRIRRTAVPFPTQDLTLIPAEGPVDLPHAVIGDPRSVLLDLAAGRLLARRYIREHVEKRERTVLLGEIRVYVLDGSSSMLGARAYMRDAILVAELATLMKRMTHQADTGRVILFYRYFTKELGPLVRIDSSEVALEAIREVMADPSTGGTDIESALIASMDTVRGARERDQDLARAQIVLITDGASPVSEQRVHEAREQISDMTVGVSVIALGEENRALRKLVARQRARGERAFYHFLPDSFLQQIARGDIDGDIPIHMPHVPWMEGSPADIVRELDQRVGGLLDELAQLERERDRAAMRELGAFERARRLGTLDDGSEADSVDNILAGEGNRASLEAMHRDRRALAMRYARWFPQAIDTRNDRAQAVMPPEPGTLEHADLESVLVVLATIAEVVELIDESELARQADAIELLERMLPDARLSPARYHGILTTYAGQVAGMLRVVHATVRWGEWWRLERPEIA